MESNTIENKERFFAQYWGQDVGRIFNRDSSIYEFIISEYSIDLLINEKYLLLKPLSSITDEDAYDAGRCWDCENANEFLQFSNDGRPSKEADILRKLGYVVEFNGISVEQQIKYGWVKLEED